MLSLVILVMAGCGNNDKPSSAPAERVVNLDSLAFDVYEKGRDTVVASCASVPYQYKEHCDSETFRTGTRFVPNYGSPITLQGEKADLGKALGLNDSTELVLRDKSPSQMKAKTSPTPVTKPKPSSVEPIKKADNTEEDFFPEWFWDLLKFILAVCLLVALLYILWEAFRRLHNRLSGPLARPQTRNSDNGDNGQAARTTSDQHHSSEYYHSSHYGMEDVNTRGAVVIGRAGDMVERTTTVTERFVVRENRPDRPNRRGNGGGYQGGDRQER